MDSVPKNVTRDSQVVVSLLVMFWSNSAPIWRVKFVMSSLWKEDKVIEDILQEFPLNIYLAKEVKKILVLEIFKSKSIEFL